MDSPHLLSLAELVEAAEAILRKHGNDLPWQRGPGRDTWRAALDAMIEFAAPTKDDAILRDALAGFGDDYMTSEKHHPGYVLIPTDQFERIAAALRALSQSHSQTERGEA